MNNQYNVLIDFVGALLIIVIFMTERSQKHHRDSLNEKLMRWLMLCCTLVFVVDIPGLLLDGKSFPGAHALLWFIDTTYWILQIIYCYLWLLFADYWAFGLKEHLKKRGIVYGLLMILELLLILTTSFTGWVFTIDDANVYARGSFYLWNMLPYGAYIVAAIIVMIRGYRISSEPECKRRCISLIVYMFLPACGVILDAFVYGISWVWPMVAISLLMVYLNVQQQAISEEQLAAAKIQAELTEKQLAATKLESELTEGRIAIMLSQIQPHFLYNALNTMDALCEVDTRAAQKAIRSFARYLRGNLDALSRKTPITFREEISHVQQYLTLETFRFDNINVEYDLEAMEFMLPPLSLQPIVENAVKYGVLYRENGGQITITTRDKKDYIQLTVQDDGVGFDMMRINDDGRSHIGISNVRSRLETMCGGTLTVESTPDVGTIVTFIIPKGGIKV